MDVLLGERGGQAVANSRWSTSGQQWAVVSTSFGYLRTLSPIFSVLTSKIKVSDYNSMIYWRCRPFTAYKLRFWPAET